MSSLLEKVKVFDVFGASFSFTINNSTSIKTLAGGIFSLLTFGFFLFAFIAFGQDFYYKLNPKVLIQQMVLSNQTIYDLQNYTIPDQMMIVTVEKELDAVLNWIIDTNLPYSFQKKRAPYDTLHPCNESFVLDNFYADNHQMGIDEMKNDKTYYCYNFSQYPFGLHDSGSGAGSVLVNPVSIWTYRCGKTARGIQGKSCPSGFNMTKNIGDRNVEVWTYITLYNPENISQPLQKSLQRMANTGLSKTVDTNVFLNVAVHENHDNDGFLTDNNKVTKMISVDSCDATLTPLDSPKDFYDMTITLGYIKLYWKYQRTYMKVQDLLAQVGGVIKAVFTIFQVASFLFNRWFLDLYLLSLTETHKIESRGSKIPYKIPHNDNKEKMNFDKKAKDNSISINKLQVDLNKSNTQDMKINNFTSGKFVSLEKNIKTKISLCEYTKYFLLCGSESVTRSGKLVTKLRSFENIFYQSSQFIHLKNMLMNEDQRKAFDLLNTEFEFSQVESFQQIKDYFANKNRTKTMNEYDKYIEKNIRLKLE